MNLLCWHAVLRAQEMMWPSRLLVVGAAACRHFEAQGATVMGTSRRRGSDHLYLDLTVPQGWDVSPEADAAVICAGVTSIAGCAQDPAASMQVNARGTVSLAWKLAAQGTFVLYLSSNQVFDGVIVRRDRESAPCPVSEYGRHKALAEGGMRHLIDRGMGAVLRLTKVVTPYMPVVDTWRRDLRAGKSIGPFSNLPLAPVSVGFALDMMESILTERSAGWFHASSVEDSSYLSLAQVVVEQEGVDPALIRPVEAVAGSIGFSTGCRAFQASTCSLRRTSSISSRNRQETSSSAFSRPNADPALPTRRTAPSSGWPSAPLGVRLHGAPGEGTR